MAGQAFDLTRLERIERRLQALEMPRRSAISSRATPPSATTTMMRRGSLRSLPRMQPGKARVSVGSKAATQFAGSFRVQPGSSHSPSITA
jgi:hypothetical protein